METIKFSTTEQLIEKCNDTFKKINEDQYSLDNISNFFYSSYQNESNLELKKSLQLIEKICCLKLNINSKNFFDPWFSKSISGIFDPNSLTEEELNYLNQLVGNIQQPILKAIIGDIVWCYHKQKNEKNAIIAIHNYMSIPFEKFSFNVYSFWQRAIQLSLSLKSQKQLLNEVTEKLIKELEEPTSDCDFHICEIAKLLIETKNSNPEILNNLAEKLLTITEKFNLNNLNKIEQYLEVTKKIFQILKNKEKEMYCTNLLFQAKVNYADFRMGDSPLAANHLYKEALQIYRTIPKEYRNEQGFDIMQKINNSKKNMVHELKTSQIEFKIPQELINQSINHVKGKSSLTEALYSFSNIYFFNHQTILEEVNKVINKSLVSHISTQITISPDGRKTGTIDNSSDQNKYMAHSKMRISFIAYIKISPALNQIKKEHTITKEFLIELCEKSKIIPKDRINLIAKALYFGFEDDFSTCIHLLAPQTENVVRQILKNNNVITTIINKKEGKEDEIGLSSLLEKPESKNILGDDLWFELQAVFTSSLGLNLRNEVAHGLLNDENSESGCSIYAWWLMLKLIIEHSELS